MTHTGKNKTVIKDEGKITCSVTNKTNQKQVVEVNGTSHNFKPYGTIQIEGDYRSVAKAFDFWVSKEILTIRKNQ